MKMCIEPGGKNRIKSLNDFSETSLVFLSARTLKMYFKKLCGFLHVAVSDVDRFSCVSVLLELSRKFNTSRLSLPKQNYVCIVFTM